MYLSAPNASALKSLQPSLNQSRARGGRMSDLTTTPATRTVTTKDKLFSLNLPFKARPDLVPDPRGCSPRVTRRSMNALLNEGYRVRCPITAEILTVYVRPITAPHVELLARLAMKTMTTGRRWLKL